MVNGCTIDLKVTYLEKLKACSAMFAIYLINPDLAKPVLASYDQVVVIYINHNLYAVLFKIHVCVKTQKM